MSPLGPADDRLLLDLQARINAERPVSAATFSAKLTHPVWQVGRRPQTKALVGERAAYGSQVIETSGRVSPGVRLRVAP